MMNKVSILARSMKKGNRHILPCRIMKNNDSPLAQYNLYTRIKLCRHENLTDTIRA